MGQLLSDIKIKIIDKQGKNISDNSEGEIVVKTPFLTKLFSNKNNLNELSQGWFQTGDIGKIIKQNLFITGRKKDLIIRGCINISPANIENHFQHTYCIPINSI